MNSLNDKEIIHYNLMDAITKKIYQNNLDGNTAKTPTVKS